MSFAHLSTVGTLKYNGYAFDGSANVKVSVEFVMDEAQRTILYHRHVITAHAFVQNDATTDTDLEAIRSKLGHQGQELIFINKGFGDDLVVNSTSGAGLRDVKWGPKPKILTWEPVGSANCCEVVWECEVCVPKCSPQSNGRYVGVMAINYGVNIGVTDKGLSTRTITGYLEIAQTRIGKNVPDSADNYRYLIQPPLPDGFKRTSDWQFSPDKSRVNFSIVDLQIESKNPYPAGVTNIGGTHRCVWSNSSRQRTIMRNSISLDIETPLGAPPLLGWQLFGNLVRQRVGIAQRNGRSTWLEEVSAEEAIFGTSSRFSCTYRALQSPAQALNAQAPAANAIPNQLFDFVQLGLWQPVGTNWSLWKNSMARPFSNYGLSGLTVPAANDVIIDLCDAGVSVPWNGQNQIAPPQQTAFAPTFANALPRQDQSYLKYRLRLIIINGKPTVRQSPMQPSDNDNAPGDLSQSQPMQFPPRGSGQGQGTADTIQQAGPGQFSVIMLGEVQRAGYPIPRPRLTTFGGQTPVEADGVYHTEQLGCTFGIPSYYAAFSVTYMLPAAPNSVTPPLRLES